MPYRAMVCKRLDGPDSLEPAEMEPPMLQVGEVRVAVDAAGLNFPDLLMTRGGYQLKPELPFVPGMEIAGRILETGPGVEGWNTGDRVITLPRTGGYAEQLVCSAGALLPAPAAFSDVEAATFLVGGKTAYHSLVDRARLAAGETLMVLGATGGVGLAAVELGKVLGATVIAVGSSDEKLAVARERGADTVINHTREDFRQAVKDATDGRGVDVVYDPVGGTLSEQSARLLAWGGRLLVIGFASGRVPALRANHALIKGYGILGVRAGESARRNPEQGRKGLQALLEYAAQGHLRPHVCRTFPLEQAAEALKFMENRGVTGRVALTMNAR
ncbi:MAG: NADPH:quinone oxidoreductase family protein [Ectothiorhodospiraceae bacterium]|nr:NADPH:quinone oxidoreductase family protein [Ectothiorhodospiraceae bacterium]